jgi:acetylornithine deacetylase
VEEPRQLVFERIDALRDEAVALLSELVRIDSTNPSFTGVDRAAVIGGETRCNEILRERYERAGLEAHWVAPDPERKNLVGVRSGSGAGRSLILNGHVDTVPPVDSSGWLTGDPWKPEVRDGLLYGLGSTDMKGSDTAMWLVAQALEDAGARLAGELQLHSVVGEEMMEHELGTTACVRAGFRADAAVVTEPSSFPRPLTVSPVAPGNWYLRITVEGKSTHCGNRSLAIRPGGPGDEIGVNALEKGVKIVIALQELEAQWGMTKSHPYFSPGFFTLLPGVFHSDPGLPIPFYFANHAKIEYSIWYPPQQEAREVAQEIEDYVLAASRLDPWLREHPPRFEWLNNWPPMETPWEHPIVQTMVRAREQVSGASVPPPSPEHPVNFGAASDGSFLEDEGIPTVVFGPGNLRLAHCKDENVELDQVIVAAKSLAACVLEWCGAAA